jgi:hypothetical protein
MHRSSSSALGLMMCPLGRNNKRPPPNSDRTTSMNRSTLRLAAKIHSIVPVPSEIGSATLI